MGNIFWVDKIRRRNRRKKWEEEIEEK